MKNKEKNEKAMLVKLPKSLFIELKKKVAEDDVTIKAVVIRAIQLYLEGKIKIKKSEKQFDDADNIRL